MRKRDPDSRYAARTPIGTRATVTISARRFYALATAVGVSIVLVGALGTLLAIGYNDLRGRIEAVCAPLTLGGEQVTQAATNPAGRAAGHTFDESARRLGCPRVAP